MKFVPNESFFENIFTFDRPFLVQYNVSNVHIPYKMYNYCDVLHLFATTSSCSCTCTCTNGIDGISIEQTSLY